MRLSYAETILIERSVNHRRNPMDVVKILAELREEQAQVAEAIMSLERLIRSREPRRGRPPAWLTVVEPKRRGRPMGCLNRLPRYPPPISRRYNLVSRMSKSKTLFCTALLAASGLVAQNTTPLVRLYPVALDVNGQPVTDLTAADFKIVDQGKPQTIFSFRKPAGPDAPLGPLEHTNRANG